MTTLAEKRASLHASLEQHIGQVNRHNGAIAILDELIAEEAGASSHHVHGDAVMPVPQVAPARPYDAAYHENLLDQLAAPELVAPEMLPVVRVGDHDEEPAQYATCGKCVTPEHCGETGCAR